MTVKELIAKLQELPNQDWPVKVWHQTKPATLILDDYKYSDISTVKVSSMEIEFYNISLL